VHQGCGAGTQIFGSSSGHLNFLASDPTPRGLCLRLHNNLVQKIRKKALYYLYHSLTQQTISVDPEPKFALAPTSTSFWLRLQPFKIASAPGSDSSALLRTVQGLFLLGRVAGQFIVRFKLFSKWELSIGVDFKSNVLYKSIASKNIQSDMNYVLKHT